MFAFIHLLSNILVIYVFRYMCMFILYYIEAFPPSFNGLLKNRPHALNIHAALCEKKQLLHFTTGSSQEVNELSNRNLNFLKKKVAQAKIDAPAVQGFIEFMSPEFVQQWHANAANNINLLPTVSCISMTNILLSINIKHIDIWVLDVEGAELSVLHGTDWDNIHISVIVLECDGQKGAREIDNEKRNYLKSKGYTCQSFGRNCMCKHHTFVPSPMPPQYKQYTKYMFYRALRPWLNMNAVERDPRLHPQFLHFIPP
jgi:hypothetical protein